MGKKIVQSRMPRSIGGKIVKWVFVGFNILMLLWMISGINAASEGVASAANEYEQAGAAIGSGIGMALVMLVWCLGVIVLTPVLMLTRGKIVLEEIEE